MALKTVLNKIIVEPVEAETKTASGIIIPDSAKEKPQKVFSYIHSKKITRTKKPEKSSNPLDRSPSCGKIIRKKNPHPSTSNAKWETDCPAHPFQTVQ